MKEFIDSPVPYFLLSMVAIWISVVALIISHGAHRKLRQSAGQSKVNAPELEDDTVSSEKMALQHPVQPLYEDECGVVRFKRNAIVRYLLDEGPFDMNHLAVTHFSDEDREQFAQLIGYSVSGFGGLDYVSDETYDRAVEQEVYKPNQKTES